MKEPPPPMRPPGHLLSAPPPTASNSTAVTHGGTANATAAADKASTQWGPFGNAATYGADMVLAVGILLSGFVIGLILMLGVRFYLRRRRGARGGDAQRKPERSAGGPGEEKPSTPPTLYAAGKTELAGAAAECAICLTEFAEGDALRVLPACRHGFHVQCVERWLTSAGTSRIPSGRTPAPSCPVCRASCQSPTSSPEYRP